MKSQPIHWKLQNNPFIKGDRFIVSVVDGCARRKYVQYSFNPVKGHFYKLVNHEHQATLFTNEQTTINMFKIYVLENQKTVFKGKNLFVQAYPS